MADIVARESLCCPQCGFGLTGLPDDHRCPECGFGYQRDAILTLVRNELAARRGLAELVILFAAAATLLSLLPIAGTADSSLLGRGGVVRVAGIVILAGVSVLRWFRNPDNESIYWQTRSAMIVWVLLVVLSLVAPNLVISGAALALLACLLAASLHRPAYPCLAASVTPATNRSLRRLKFIGYAATAVAGVLLIAAVAS